MMKLKLIPFILIAGLVLSSCVDSGSGSRRRGSSNEQIGNNDDSPAGIPIGGGGADNAGQEDGSISNNNNSISGRAEIRHIVDPIDGTFKTKVSIPKNFTGLLYLGGLNITSLSDRLVSVRFNFGRDREPVVVPATIGRASGITPQTDIEVLILDMDNRPFENIRLAYDLYDYNDYRDGTGVETQTPTDDPLNTGLYCRGLNIEDDPTFLGSATNTQCDAAGERCLYAYANVKDSTLASFNTSVPPVLTVNIPFEPQIDLGGTGYANDSTANNLQKCLPDNYTIPSSVELGNTLGVAITGGLSFGTPITIGATNYFYQGPYRPIDHSGWEIKRDAMFSDSNSGAGSATPTGVFQKHFSAIVAPVTDADYLAQAEAGMRSFLFPRAGKLDLNQGVEYFGSTTPFADNKTLRSLLASGQSDFVNGCSMRSQFVDATSVDGISSCNVTATIELITVDPISGAETLIDQTSTSRIKLQLVRASEENAQGQEVLFSSLKTCSNNNACGASECCFNNRCWSSDLVSQCLENADVIGNLQVGATCASDFECSSLCCDQSTSTCDVHINTASEQVLCGKSPGQSCVSKEFCRQESVWTCKIVRAPKPDGTPSCVRECRNVPTFGDCVNGTCQPPVIPAIPAFDKDNPDCSQAIDPEDF